MFYFYVISSSNMTKVSSYNLTYGWCIISTKHIYKIYFISSKVKQDLFIFSVFENIKSFSIQYLITVENIRIRLPKDFSITLRSFALS